MLFVVDGKVVGQEEMSAIPPSKIQSIKVLKGGAAVKSYGESASGGVVEITLKK
jgi:outer membrane receptor for ferrienterochelin and colicin